MAQQGTPPPETPAAAVLNLIFHKNTDTDTDANTNTNANMSSSFDTFRGQLVYLNEEYQQAKAELKQAEQDRDCNRSRIIEIRSGGSKEAFECEKAELELGIPRLERREAQAEERLRLLLVATTECVAALREAANRASRG